MSEYSQTQEEHAELGMTDLEPVSEVREQPGAWEAFCATPGPSTGNNFNDDRKQGRRGREAERERGGGEETSPVTVDITISTLIVEIEKKISHLL